MHQAMDRTPNNIHLYYSLYFGLYYRLCYNLNGMLQSYQSVLDSWMTVDSGFFR